MATAQGMQGAEGAQGDRLCPNCESRVADTAVSYEEVLAKSVSYTRMGRRRGRYSSRVVTTRGNVWLCAPCAAAYNRVVALRERGAKVSRWGVFLLIGGGLFYLWLYASVRQAPALVQILPATPLLAGLVMLLAGIALTLSSRILRGGAVRFLKRPNLDKMAAPPTREAHAAPLVFAANDEPRLTPEERRTRRAQRRRRRRLIALGAVVGGIVVVAAGFWGMAVLISGEAGLGHGGTQAYSDLLSGGAAGWASDDQCGVHQGAYHVTPLPTKYAITCFAPAGAYTNFDASVTASVASGTADQAYGLAFRFVDTSNGYIFEITDSGTARVAVVKGGHVSTLSPAWAFPAGVSRVPGAAHTLTVRARGSTITCLVDGVQVGELADSTFDRGALGVGAAPGMDVAFTDFSIEPK